MAKGHLYFILSLAIVSLPLPVFAEAETADLVLLNGGIVTMDERNPHARAVAVIADRIAVVGDDTEVRKRIGPDTQVIDLKGLTAYPGFIDCHAHFLAIGRDSLQIDLKKARNWDDVVSLIGAEAKRANRAQWIVGRGWHQGKWKPPLDSPVGGMPVNDRLNEVSPRNPVILYHASGHAAIGNAMALKIAGIMDRTPNPRGGEIVRNTRSRATGVLRETAVGLVSRHVRQRSVPFGRLVEHASNRCLSRGITTLHDAGSTFAEIEGFKKLIDAEKLPLRLWVMVAETDARLERMLPTHRVVGYGNNRLTVRAIKRYMDGALGSHGAWLLKPYEDLPGRDGHNTSPPAAIEATGRIAMKHDCQLCVHAIGDRANRETLNIYRRLFAANPDRRDLRWRIEHAQHIDPVDISQFGKLGVIASMQSVHCTSDSSWVPKRIGMERARAGAYAWRSLLDSGAIVVNGTDAPIESVDPIPCFYAAVTRKSSKDVKPFFPEQCMTRLEALRSYTLDAAQAGFEEKIKGSIEKGKLADFTVLSRDILKIPADQIPGTKVVYTIVGGKIAWKAQ